MTGAAKHGPVAVSDAGSRHDSLVMLDKLTGYWVSQAIYAAARLGVADQLAAGPRPVTEVAAAVGANADALYRLLRALAGEGVFHEVAPGVFGLSPFAELLRRDHPRSLAALSVMFGDLQYQPWGDVLHSVRTGECAYETRQGIEFFEFLRRDPQAAHTFSEAMTSFLNTCGTVLDVFDFTAVRRVVDVGAAHGTLLCSILERYTDTAGVLFDLPHVVADARAHVERAGLLGRCELVGGDFLDQVPAGGDVYMLSTILHDWDDERCLRILRNCRAAMGQEGRLLVTELVIGDGEGPFFGKWLDLHMLVMHGGRDRTAAEYGRLLEAAGFAVERVAPTSFLRSVIEAVPAG
jgi:hypothetical protein